MFGIIYTIIGIIGRIGWINKQANANRIAFQKTYNNKRGTYLDMYGAERKPNGEYCKTERDPFSGDLIQKDINGKIIRNFSKEERIKSANIKDNTVIKMSELDMTGSDYVDIKGVRYLDKETREEYVIRAFPVKDNEKSGLVYFYMRTSDLLLIRITDGEKKYGFFKNINAINEFIKKYNIEQKTKCFYNKKEKYHNAQKSDKDREFKIEYRINN